MYAKEYNVLLFSNFSFCQQSNKSIKINLSFEIPLHSTMTILKNTAIKEIYRGYPTSVKRHMNISRYSNN